MYYIQFFQDDVYMFERLIDKFIPDFIPNVFFIQEEDKCQIKSESFIQSIKRKMIDSIFFDLIDFAIFSAKDESIQAKELNWIHLLSIQEIDNYFLQSQWQFDWILFTFGDYRFREFIFATKHKFINNFCGQKIIEIACEIEQEKEIIEIPQVIHTDEDYKKIAIKFRNTSFVMSKYLVENNNIFNCLSAIVFNKLEAPFERLMKSCNLNIKDLLLVSDMVPYNAEGILSRKVINLLLPGQAVLPLSGSKITGSYQNFIRKEKLFFLEFDDIEKLKNVCSRLSTSEADTMLIIPRDTHIESFKSLLLKAYNMGADPLSGEEFKYLSEIKETMSWFYGIERVYGHDSCSIFISANSELITAFDELNIQDGYRLIGCF